MNAETPAIEADASTSTALVPIAAMTPVALFSPGVVETLIERVKREARAEAAKLDISTPKGRAAIASLALKVAKTKTYMDEAGKTLTDEHRKAAEVIHAERRTIIAELVALKDEVRAPLTAWEDAEKARVAGHEAALHAIDVITVTPDNVSSQEIRDRIAQLDALPPRDWGLDFAYRAESRLATARRLLNGDLAAALQREAALAEEARLRAEAEERARQDAARQDAARQQAEREARIAAEAADKARRDAEAKADRERQETLRAAAEERTRVEREAKAQQDRIEADRQAAYDRAEAAERRRVADAAAAQEREAAAERKAESDRIAAEQKAKREQEEAVAAERKRQADEQARVEREAAATRQADERRAANLAHQGKINRTAVAALILCNITEDQAKAVVGAIARGQVPHMRIEY